MCDTSNGKCDSTNHEVAVIMCMEITVFVSTDFIHTMADKAVEFSPMVSIALTDSSDSIHGTVADSIDDIGSYLYYHNCRLELSIRSEQSAMAIDIIDAITDIVTLLREEMIVLVAVKSYMRINLDQ